MGLGREMTNYVWELETPKQNTQDGNKGRRCPEVLDVATEAVPNVPVAWFVRATSTWEVLTGSQPVLTHWTLKDGQGVMESYKGEDIAVEMCPG